MGTNTSALEQEKRPVVLLLKNGLGGDRQWFDNFIKNYPELENLDQDDKDIFYNLLNRYTEQTFHIGTSPIDNFSNNCVFTCTNIPTLFLFVSDIIRVIHFDINKFRKSMDLLVNKLGFNINIKNGDNKNILQLIVDRYLDNNEALVSSDTINSCVDILLDLGLDFSITDNMKILDERYNTRIVDMINNINIKEPGYD